MVHTGAVLLSWVWCLMLGLICSKMLGELNAPRHLDHIAKLSTSSWGFNLLCRMANLVL